MGWQFTPIKDIDSLINVLQAKCHFEDCELVERELYAVCRTDDGRRFIIACLLEHHDNGWAYLLADEAMHPYCYRCPPVLLDQSEIPDTSHWRACCHRHFAAGSRPDQSDQRTGVSHSPYTTPDNSRID